MPRSVSAKLYKKKLSKLLSRTLLFDLVFAIWNMDRIQSGDFDRAKFFKGFPDEAKTTELTSKYYLYKWRLESLLSQFFLTPPAKQRKGKKFKILNLGQWSAIVSLYSALHKTEDAEYGKHASDSVFVEMHRIAQRQFPWQRGFANMRLLLRYLYIYRTPETIERFLGEYGFALDDFVKLGFMFWAQCGEFSHTKTTASFGELGIDDHVRDAFFSHISDTAETAQKFYADNTTRNSRVANIPSRLRTHPLLLLDKEDGRYVAAPLADLVFLRVTEGLFYDFVQFSDLRELIANRFVDYCRELILNGRNDFDVVGEITYRNKQNPVKSPDLFLINNGKPIVAVECKARRMAHAAQFGADPVEEAISGFEEIAKGIFQLWRYLAHSEQGLIPDTRQAKQETLLLLLTLDNWMDMPEGIMSKVVELATRMADEKGVPENARKAVSFASIAGFEYLIERGTTDQILETIKAQSTEKYENWMISGIFDDLFGAVDPIDPFTEEDLKQHVSWWDQFDAIAN